MPKSRKNKQYDTGLFDKMLDDIDLKIPGTSYNAKYSDDEIDSVRALYVAENGQRPADKKLQPQKLVKKYPELNKYPPRTLSEICNENSMVRMKLRKVTTLSEMLTNKLRDMEGELTDFDKLIKLNTPNREMFKSIKTFCEKYFEEFGIEIEKSGTEFILSFPQMTQKFLRYGDGTDYKKISTKFQHIKHCFLFIKAFAMGMKIGRSLEMKRWENRTLYELRKRQAKKT